MCVQILLLRMTPLIESRIQRRHIGIGNDCSTNQRRQAAQ